MENGSRFVRLFIFISLAVAFGFIASCKKAPEMSTPTPIIEPTPFTADIESLELPQVNDDLKVTLADVPAGIVITYNHGNVIEFVDSARPDLRFDLYTDFPEIAHHRPTSADEFEQFIGKLNEGKITDSGTLRTVFGKATWLNGTYFEEETDFQNLRVFVAHPTGSGQLIVSSVSPEGVASLDELLTMISGLLTHIQ
jgi:hypothetical protein